MQREELGDLLAFLAVAEEESFTKAAARLGTSQSSLSLIIKRLEARLGVRLLTRTTRSVAPTEAGEQLFSTLAPAFGTIEAQLSALSEFRDKPAGNFRITAGQHSIDTILWPKLSAFLLAYPDQGRARRRVGADGHRGRAVRCRSPAGRPSREGYDRGPYRAARAYDRRWSPFVLEGSAATEDAAGTDDAPLHQPAPA